MKTNKNVHVVMLNSIKTLPLHHFKAQKYVELVLLSPHNFMSVTLFPANHGMLKRMILVSLPMA
jgi:hypothetical protein